MHTYIQWTEKNEWKQTLPGRLCSDSNTISEIKKLLSHTTRLFVDQSVRYIFTACISCNTFGCLAEIKLLKVRSTVNKFDLYWGRIIISFVCLTWAFEFYSIKLLNLTHRLESLLRQCLSQSTVTLDSQLVCLLPNLVYVQAYQDATTTLLHILSIVKNSAAFCLLKFVS
jgi:hypothetical protein